MTDPEVVFVTTEFEPITPGGAGTLVSGIARRLADQGGDIVVLLIGSDHGTSHHGGVSVEGVPVEGGFMERSMVAATALAELNSDVRIERVEFQDFEGLAFTTLSRRSELGLSNVPITVRFHGPTHLLLEGAGVEPSPEFLRAGVMEEESFAMSDAVLVPSDAMGGLVVDRYGVEPRRVVVAPPIVPEVTPTGYRPARHPEIVSYGRLAEAKGSRDLLDACVPLLREDTNLRLRYIGTDGWNITENRSMRESLSEKVPTDLKQRVVFEPSPGLDGLPDALSGAWIAVVPSRFESFCLAAHEVRAIGLPTVVPDLAAFRPFFSEGTGGVRYDGTVPDLTATLRELLTDRARLERLAQAPPPIVGDPLGPYDEPPPSTRPLAAQSALGTAAMSHLDAETATVDNHPGVGRRIASAALSHLPVPVARVAVRVLPRSLKDRFRSVADWRVVAERRADMARRASIHRRIEAGEFPDLEDPDTTIVIPCFNQGEYLDEAIMSVLEQTDPSFEIVVVDDGSTDPVTVEILDNLKWPRTHVLRQANLGLPAARNAGISAGRGRFVVPLDADDALEPDYLSVLKTALVGSPDVGYVHCNGRYFGDMDAYWITRPFNPYQLLLSNSVLGCVLLRRDAWEAVGGYDESMVEGNEDWDLWLRLLETGWDQIKVPQPLFRYRRVGTSMSISTLARLEDARIELAHQHGDLYGTARALKRDWYPWVSVLVTPDSDLNAIDRQDLTDVEVIGIGYVSDSLEAICESHSWPLRSGAVTIEDAVRKSRGKFVVEWDPVLSAHDGSLGAMARSLERDSDVATAGPASDRPVMWRRWVLLDPEADPKGYVTVSSCDANPGLLRRGIAPTDGWTLPEDLPEPELVIIRQPPEEAGEFPGWLSDVSEPPGSP